MFSNYILKEMKTAPNTFNEDEDTKFSSRMAGGNLWRAINCMIRMVKSFYVRTSVIFRLDVRTKGTVPGGIYSFLDYMSLLCT